MMSVCHRCGHCLMTVDGNRALPGKVSVIRPLSKLTLKRYILCLNVPYLLSCTLPMK